MLLWKSAGWECGSDEAAFEDGESGSFRESGDWKCESESVACSLGYLELSWNDLSGGLDLTPLHRSFLFLFGFLASDVLWEQR